MNYEIENKRHNFNSNDVNLFQMYLKGTFNLIDSLTDKYNGSSQYNYTKAIATDLVMDQLLKIGLR